MHDNISLKYHTISIPALVKADRPIAFGMIKELVNFIMVAYCKCKIRHIFSEFEITSSPTKLHSKYLSIINADNATLLQVNTFLVATISI